MLGEEVAKRMHLWRTSSQNDALGAKQLPTLVLLPPPGGPESWFLEARCTGLIWKNVIPTEGRKHLFKKRVKKIASAGKRATKVGVGECYAYVGGSGGVVKSPK